MSRITDVPIPPGLNSLAEAAAEAAQIESNATMTEIVGALNGSVKLKELEKLKQDSLKRRFMNMNLNKSKFLAFVTNQMAGFDAFMETQILLTSSEDDIIREFDIEFEKYTPPVAAVGPKFGFTDIRAPTYTNPSAYSPPTTGSSASSATSGNGAAGNGGGGAARVALSLIHI